MYSSRILKLDKYPEQDTFNMYDLFKTPSNLLTVYYSCDNAEEFESLNSISFDMENPPKMCLEATHMTLCEQPPFEELWSKNTMDLSKYGNSDMSMFIAINAMMNQIARLSRRGCGNIVFVPTEGQRQKVHEHFKFNNFKVHTDNTLKPNELRVTYWKVNNRRYNVDGTMLGIRETDEPQFVDGGIQITPEGFACIKKQGKCMSDYHDYFVRGFM